MAAPLPRDAPIAAPQPLLLEVRDLTVEYVSGDYRIRPLDRLNVTAEAGELVVLLGPSGCGKTTLLSCLAGLLTPAAGTISVGGTDVTSLRGDALARYRRETVGIVFQSFNLVPSLNAAENVMAPLAFTRTPRREAKARAAVLLERVGLADRARHRPGELSGGQQQRVAIARALVHDPPVVLADEPIAHLDHIQVEDTLRLIRELAAPGRLVVVSTHDDRVTKLADRVVDLVPRGAPTEGAPAVVELEPGGIVFDQGDRSDLVYVVEAGEVELFRVRADGSEEFVAIVRPGGYFGELGPLLGLPRSASARARTAARVTGYPAATFRRMFGGGGRLR